MSRHLESAIRARAVEDPLVSIVIPSYNRLTYLKEAVASVLAQTFTGWQLTVVDDGSTDGTGDYLRSLRDARIRVERQEHCGNPARLRNVGVRLSGRRHVASLDSDDLWEPTKLERQLAAMAEPGVRWSYTGFDMIDEAGRPLGWIAGGPWQPYFRKHRGAAAHHRGGGSDLESGGRTDTRPRPRRFRRKRASLVP